MNASALPVPDRKRKRASWFSSSHRIWWRAPDGQIIRVLCFDSWLNAGCHGAFEPREFSMRLANNDPRPRGLHAKGMEWSQHIADHYRSFPLNQWVEEVGPFFAPIARDRNGNQLLLTAGERRAA